MTKAEIGICLLTAAFWVMLIVITLLCGAHDREIDELRHRITMLEMQKDGDGNAQ